MPEPNALRSRLEAGAEQLGLALGTGACDQLLALLKLLERWNQTYNLTAIAEPGEALVKHVFDSLVAAPAVQGSRVLDVGTGAGFPGLPLAVLAPARHFTLLDSNRKKLRFVTQAAAELGLANVSTVHARAEAHEDAAGFDTVTCRALAPLERFIGWAGHLVAPGGRLLALKGPIGEDELAAVPAGWRTVCEPVVVPFLDGRRTLVVISRDGDA
ncbi:MAG: 16S rRNA (guanine(527)-N(7))-methyltransferase RsmG [Pseudomonadota bacterium]